MRRSLRGTLPHGLREVLCCRWPGLGSSVSGTCLGWPVGSAAQDAAASLRAAIPQLPYPVVDALDGDLGAVIGLLSELFPGDSRHHAVVAETEQAREQVVSMLRGQLAAVEHAITEVAAILASPTDESGADAPLAPVQATGSRRAAVARAKSRPRHKNKDIEALFGWLEKAGYGVESTSNSHFRVYCPCGGCPTRVISSTPSTNADRYDARRLFRSGCHTRRNTDTQGGSA